MVTRTAKHIILFGRLIVFSVHKSPKVSEDGRVAIFWGLWYQRFDGTKLTCADPSGSMLGWTFEIWFRPLERSFKIDATYRNPNWVPGLQKFTNLKLEEPQTQTSPIA